MAKDNPRQGRPPTVVVTVRIRYALDALAAALAGAGELVDAIVTEGAGDAGRQGLMSTVHPGRLH